MVALGSVSVAVSSLRDLLFGSKKIISDINQECAQRNLPPAFYRADLGDGVISGNSDYRFEGFGLAFDSTIIPKPKITFWVHYKPGSSEHQELGVFGLPIHIGQMALFDLIRGSSSIVLDEITLESKDDEECTVPVSPHVLVDSQPSYTPPPPVPTPISGVEQESIRGSASDFVPLKKGAIDSVGASRYRKTATVAGLAVTALQQTLTEIGLTVGEVDGWFGEGTEKALKTLQRNALDKRRLQAGKEIEIPITYQGFVLGEYDLPTHRELQVWVQNKYRVVESGEPLAIPSPGTPATQNVVQPSRWNLALAQAPTTGASQATAAANGYQGGIEASFKMAEHDWPLIQPLMPKFLRAGEMFNVPTSLLAAIASRESHAGSVLDGCWGDKGNGFGIMQVDKRAHQLEGSLSDPSSQEHINQAARIFVNCLKQVEQKHPTWEDAYVLKGATAAYNFGVANVCTGSPISYRLENNQATLETLRQ